MKSVLSQPQRFSRLYPGGQAGEGESGPSERAARPALQQVRQQESAGSPGGERRASAPRREPLQLGRTKPLEHHEVQEVAYQVAAKLNGNAITDRDELRRLRDLNETMDFTRRQLKSGRANVAADVKPSDGHNRVGAAVVDSFRVQADTIYGPFHGPWPGIETEAAMAIVMGAGHSDQHATLTSLAHAEKLADGETVETIVNTIVPPGHRVSGHSWSEVHAPARNGVAPSPIVGDSWANGPAARLKDTVWGPYADVSQARLRLDREEGSAHWEAAQNLILTYQVDGPEHDEVRNQVAIERQWNRRKFPSGPEAQVIAPQLAQAARAELARLAPLHREVNAAITAREAYDLSVKEATACAQAVLLEAGRLDEQDRPEIVKPLSYEL